MGTVGAQVQTIKVFLRYPWQVPRVGGGGFIVGVTGWLSGLHTV